MTVAIWVTIGFLLFNVVVLWDQHRQTVRAVMLIDRQVKYIDAWLSTRGNLNLKYQRYDWTADE